MAPEQAEDRSTKTRDDHGVHVAAWKKGEVHEIPKNNYPVGKSLISQVFFPLQPGARLDLASTISPYWVVHGRFLGSTRYV